jgi:hypothetical protein
MVMFVSEDDVRGYLSASETATGQWSDGFIQSNIRVASSFLQRATGRQWEAQSSTTKTFTTFGRSAVVLPGLRGTTPAVELNGATLTLDETFYLVPDFLQTGIYVGIEFPRLRDAGDYRSYADWFDRNYDSPLFRGRLSQGLPNNLSIGPTDWGVLPANYPDELLHATKVLAGWDTIRPDALLSGVKQTPEGNIFDMSRLPAEVSQFIASWKLSTAVVAL